MPCDCCGTASDEVSGEIEPDGSGELEDLLSRPLPEPLARELGAVYDAGSVATFGDWLGTMAEALDREPTADDMCCVDDALHTVEYDGTTGEYICVVDPLMVPAIHDEPAVVRSEVPGSEETVTARVDADGELTVDPGTAVVSFGASRAVAEDVDDPLERGYAALCEYTHAFPDEEHYESWTETVDAETTAIPYADAVEMAVAVAERFAD